MELPAHTLQRGKATGWEYVLFAELRRRPQTPEAKRVETILGLLVAANSALEEWRVPVPANKLPEFLRERRKRTAFERAYFDVIGRLNDALKRYRWQSAIIGDMEGFGEELHWNNKVQKGDPWWEYAIVRYLLDRTKMPGELSRVRRCSNCRNWLYATTGHQRFCGDVCRRRYTAASPEFKEKRRNYMKQIYRPEQKQKDERSLALAKGTVQQKKRGT